MALFSDFCLIIGSPHSHSFMSVCFLNTFSFLVSFPSPVDSRGSLSAGMVQTGVGGIFPRENKRTLDAAK